MNRITMFLNKYWILLSITVVGTILRLYNLTAISLWHDEAFSALLIKYPWGEMFYRIGLDVHPPMYYIFLRIWHYVLGDSLFSLRLLSVLFGVGTIIAIYILVKKIFNSTSTALAAALLVAVNPFQIQYVTEARMYTMGAFFAVVSAILLTYALTNTKNYFAPSALITKPTKKTLVINYALFTISASILTYTHYYLLFTVAVLGLFGLFYLFVNFKWQLKTYIGLVLSGIGIAALFVPWFSWFMYQYKQVGAGYWIPPMNIWSIPSTLYDLLFRIAQPSESIMVLVSILVLWVLYRVIRSYEQTEKWLILGLFLAPFAGSLLFALLAALKNQSSSVYLVRYFLFASPFLLTLLVLWFEKIKIAGLKWLALALIVLVNLYGVGYYWVKLDVGNKKGMAALSSVTNANVAPTDKIFVASSFEFFNFKYYNKSAVRPLLYTNNNKVENLPHFAGTAILTNDDLVLNFTDSVASGDTVWLIWTSGFGGTKPIVPNNWEKLEEIGFIDVRPYPGTYIAAIKYKIN